MSYPAYPNYKDSGVEWLGEVPAHWGISKLKHLARIRNGRDYKIVEVESGGYPVIGSGGEFARANDFLYDGESVLLGRKGTIDKPLYINGPFWTVDTMFYTELSHRVDGRFLYYYATCFQFGQYSTNTALPSMAQEDLANIYMAAPGPSEQALIAAFLDHETARIDALVEEQKRLIALLKEKRQAVISHAVTKGLDPDVPMKDSGVEWLGEVPKHWDVLRIGSVYVEAAEKGLPELPVLRVSIHHGVSDRELNEEESDRKVTRIEDREKYKRVRHGDLVYNMMRAWQGGFGAVLVDGLVSPAYVVARPKLDDVSEFIEQLLRTANAVEEMRSRSYGITDFRLRLYWENFKNLKIALPPREERQEIVNWLKKIIIKSRALESEADKNISFLEERRSALISAAVTGKIDVRGWQAAREADPSEMLMAAEERATYG
jgi:type I restriction enzyme S subunit|tara:strand:- start:817 stop:2115 length:1299 start_codon:yes stop_codon:yes gene_type:complete